MLLDLPAGRLPEAAAGRLRELHEAYREDYRATTSGTRTPLAPMRARPGHCAGARRWLFSFGADAQTARGAGEFY